MVGDTEYRLNCGRKDLVEYVSEHQYLSMHYRNDRWMSRERASNANSIFLKGSFTQRQAQERFLLSRISDDSVLTM